MSVPLGEMANVCPDHVSEIGTEHCARQEFPSQEYPELQANVHCHAVDELCQVPDIDCEVAVEVALTGTVDQHTSAMQEIPDGTNPGEQEVDSQEIVAVQNEQKAVADADPFNRGLVTDTDFPLSRTGSEYPETVDAEHSGGEPVGIPSSKAPVDDGFAKSFKSPVTDAGLDVA